MKLAIYRSHESPRSAGQVPGAWQIRFGDEVVVIADDAQWTATVAGAERSGADLREHPAAVDPSRLYLVVQNGRLFQQAHPDVPVIVDHGRYLLTELSSDQARTIGKGDETCYLVQPVKEQMVAFEVHEPRAAPAPIPWVQQIVDRVSVATFKADLTRLVEFTTRFSTSPRYLEASAWAEQQLRGMGYHTRSEIITVGRGSSRNVIADKPGGGPGQRALILVTAHLDSINRNASNGNTEPAPGADDNASGSAGALQIARALKNHAGVHDLRFVLFGGEEEGLLGSKQYVARLTQTERARIRAVVNMDMIATLNTASPTVLLEGAPVSQTIIDRLSEAAATYSDLTIEKSHNFANSDHVPFIRASIPAVLTIEGADGTNLNIHSANDTIEKLNFELGLRILRMNTAFVATELAKR